MKKTLQSKMLVYAETHALDRVAIRIMTEQGCGVQEAYRLAVQKYDRISVLDGSPHP